MKRLAVAFLAGVAGAGIVMASSGIALAGSASNPAEQSVAPISGNAPDIVALDTAASSAPDVISPAPVKKDNSAKTKLETVSPSIVAMVGPAPAPGQEKPEDKGHKVQPFDPGPMVIRAGLIGDATPAEPITISDEPATEQPKVAEDGHQLAPQGESGAPQADQKPVVSPK
jgi:hypothetical protein